jgi:hypothetical protein
MKLKLCDQMGDKSGIDSNFLYLKENMCLVSVIWKFRKVELIMIDVAISLCPF